jgi:uncharacterized Zn finger protein
MSSGWTSRWLDLVEASSAFDEAALRRGADYAAFDWQLDVEIEPGRASTTATSGKRMQYEASISVPTLAPADIDAIVESIASETQRVAAVLDGELPTETADFLRFDPGDLVPSCTCQSIDRPCKHAAAVAHLIADAITDDPFDLLHLRGLPRADLVARLTEARTAGTRQPGADDSATAEVEPATSTATDPEDALVWSIGDGELPRDLPVLDGPGSLAPFPTPPPPGASFTEAGLRMLADDGAKRAHTLLTQGARGWIDLDATTDMARRAADVEGTDEWKALVDRAQVTSQELRARVIAWRAGGPTAVAAHIAPAEIVPDPDDRAVQRRRTHDGQWVRFTKVKGRWLAAGMEPRVD